MSVENHKPLIWINSFKEEAVRDTLKQIDKIESDYPASQPIVVHIDSYGGAVHGLATLYDRIKNLNRVVVTYTSSKAMSAGAILLASAGTPGYRYASPQADIMIHEIQAAAFGDIKDIENNVKYLRAINKKWMHILAKSMGLKGASDIRRLIKEKVIGHEIYLSANQAKKLNIIDEICSIKMVPFYGWDVVVNK